MAASTFSGAAGASRTSAIAAFSLAVPVPGASDAVRSPLYVSLKTQSFVILTDGADPQILNLGKSSPGCHAINAGGSLSCVISVQTTAGTHDFTVTSYGQVNGQGPALSTNVTGPIDIKVGGSTPIAITLAGIVAGGSLTLQTPRPPVGRAVAIPLTVVLKDASGAIIVGGGPFKDPITLTSSDTTNAALSRTTLRSPADEVGITANYDGANVAPVTFAASGNGITPGSVVGAVLTPVANASKIYLAVENSVGVFGTGTVLTYLADGTPSTPTIENAHAPSGVAVDAAGKIYLSFLGTYTSGGGVSTYNADGTPSTPTITGLIGGPEPVAVAVGAGLLDVGYWYGGEYIGTVVVYNAQSGLTQGNPTVPEPLNEPTQVAVDATGKIYVGYSAYEGDCTLTTYSAQGGAPGNPTIDYPFPKCPSGVAVDAAGKIYVSFVGYNSVLTYNPDGTPTTPIITDGLDGPGGIAVDEAGKIYVVNNKNITTYNPDGSRTTPTIALPAGRPAGIAVH